MENIENKPDMNEEQRSVKNNIFKQNEQFLQKNPNFVNTSQEQSTNPLDNEEENKHLKIILSSFYNYQVIFS